MGETHSKLPKALQQSIKNKRAKNSGVAQRAAADVAAAQITVRPFTSSHAPQFGCKAAERLVARPLHDVMQTESDKLAASQAALERKTLVYDAIGVNS